MIFKETGNQDNPTIILLHGGGLSNWSFSAVAAFLEPDYHMITPIIDGHGEDGDIPFLSIEQSAQTLLDYIDRCCGGSVFAIGGLSLGAQITAEILSMRGTAAQFAILESALVLPMKGVDMSVRATQALWFLTQKKWFAKMQAKALFLPEEMFEDYYADTAKMSKETMTNMLLSNGKYTLKDNITQTKAQVLIIAGEKEIKIIKESATLLHNTLPGSELYWAKHMRHGELSLSHSKDYSERLRTFFAKYV